MFGSEAVKWTVEHSHEEWVLIMISSCKIPLPLCIQTYMASVTLIRIVSGFSHDLQCKLVKHTYIQAFPIDFCTFTSSQRQKKLFVKRIITPPIIIPKEERLKCTFTAISIMPLVTWHQQCIIPSYFLSVFPVRLKWEGEIQWKSSSDGNGVFCYKFMYLFTHMWAKCFWELASKWSNSLSQSWFSL